MHKTNIRSTYRQNPDGVGTHKVKAHKRYVKGAGEVATAPIGFQPVTPARASSGVLIGGATYWLFSGTMHVLMLIGFSLTVAVSLLMSYDKVQKKRSSRGKRKRPVPVLWAKVKKDAAKHKITTWKSGRKKSSKRWRGRAKRWLRFRLNKSRQRIRGWIITQLQKRNP